jgi:hypothetical protein
MLTIVSCTFCFEVDGSAWMAFYALCMMRIAIELSVSLNEGKKAYEDMAIMYLGYFTRISQALNDESTGNVFVLLI